MEQRKIYLSHNYEQRKSDFIDGVPNYFINDVLLVKGLNYNLLSISQYSDKGNQNAPQCLVYIKGDKWMDMDGFALNKKWMGHC